MIEPLAAKRGMRALVRAARPSGDDAQLVAQLLDLDLSPEGIVAGVWPLPGEPDLVPAWKQLSRRGHRVVLPETTAPGDVLRFRLWRPDCVMLEGRFRTSHPDGPAMRPDIVFVPLLAWDRRMHRLGYGGGYYDRTLSALPDAVAIGIGFAAQEVAAVPVGPHDVRLSAVLVEHGLVTAEGQMVADPVSGRHRRA